MKTALCPALTFLFIQNMAVDALAKLEMLDYSLVMFPFQI